MSSLFSVETVWGHTMGAGDKAVWVKESHHPLVSQFSHRVPRLSFAPV